MNTKIAHKANTATWERLHLRRIDPIREAGRYIHAYWAGVGVLACLAFGGFLVAGRIFWGD